MPSIVLPIEIVADEAEVETTVPVTVIRQKALDKFVFRHEITKETQVAYVGYPLITFGRSIGMVDHTIDIPENRSGFFSFQNWKRIEGNSFVSNSPDVYITNKAIIRGNLEVPLFYGMALPDTTVDATASSYLRRESDFYWSYDTASKVLYTNIGNYWDEALRDFRGINVRYNVNVSGTVTGKTALFSGATVYREMTFDDIDPLTFAPYPDRTVYSIDKNLDGTWTFTLNGTGPFYISQIPKTKISVRRDGGIKPSDPWLLRISNGTFYRNLTSGRAYSYEPLEYKDQRFFPYFPYVTFTGRAEVLDKKTLKLPEDGLVINPSLNLHLDIVVRNSKGELKFIYSTSSLKIGKPLNRWDWDSRDMRYKALEASYDQIHSVVSISNMPPLLSNDQVQVQYAVRKDDFVFRDLNLNPNFNTRIVDHDYLVYMVPSSQAEDGKTVFYVEYDYVPPDPVTAALGYTRITRCSQPSLSAVIIGDDLEDFKKNYCAEIVGWGGDSDNPYQYVPLATTSFKQSFDVEEIVAQDIRLKPTIDHRRQLEILLKYPWIYYNKLYSNKKLEYPDKYFVLATVDKEHVLELDEAKFSGHLMKHLGVGTSLLVKPGGIQPRVRDIYCVESEVLLADFMPEKPGVIHHVYQLREGATIPDYLLDSLIGSYVVSYSNELHTESIDVSSLTRDICKFYIILELPDGTFSKPSKLYEVKIRYV